MELFQMLQAWIIPGYFNILCFNIEEDECVCHMKQQ